VDSPQQLFDAPLNLFRRRFIGSPAMNFVTAQVVRDDGPSVVFAATVSRSRRRSLKPGRPATVFRPGRDTRRPAVRLRDAGLADSGWARLPVEADVTEELGSEIHVIFTINAPIVQHSSLSQAISTKTTTRPSPLPAGSRSGPRASRRAVT